MVAAGHPAGVKTAHPGLSDQDILDRLIERMTHMEDPRNVRRGDHDRKGRTAIRLAVEITAAEPVFVPFLFGRGRDIVLAQFHAHTMWEFKWSAKIGQKKIPRFAGEFLIKYRRVYRLGGS